MPPAQADAIAPGSRWETRGGVHAGQEVVVERTTELSVHFRIIGGGVNSHANSGEKTHVMSRESFLKRYRPWQGGHGTSTNGVHFRQKVKLRKVPKEVAPVVVPAAGVLNTGSLVVETMVVTPDLARSWLARGGVNRNLRETHVNSLAGAMGRGEWQLNGEAIKLDNDGVVRDGQHRLHAIIKSNTPIQTLVVRGATEEAFDTMDTGAKRSPNDVLKIRGAASTADQAGAARVLLSLELHGIPQARRREQRAEVSNVRIVHYVLEHPEILEGVQLMTRIRRVLQGGNAAWSAAMVLFYRIDPERTREFAEMLITGANLYPGHPVLALRARMTSARNSAGAWTSSEDVRTEHLALVIKAWNAWLAGETVDRLVWNPRGAHPEPFPEVARPKVRA